MGKINWPSVVLCGLLTGLVLNVIDGVFYGVVLKDDIAAAMTSINRAGAAEGSAMVWYIVCDFLLGIYLLWLYAAIRPRYGAGPRTAVITGVAMWVLFGVIHWISEKPLALFPTNVYAIALAVGLVEFFVATAAGARFYKEA